MNAFHVLGGLAALWALLVSFLGISRENFAASKGQERLVALVSVVLVLAAIGSAIYTGATESHDERHEDEESALLRGL